MIRYLNCGADGLMVRMVETAQQARAIVEIVRYACPADYDQRLVIVMIDAPTIRVDPDICLTSDPAPPPSSSRAPCNDT